MHYALSLPNGGPCGDARTLGELARLAEEAGWEAVFLEDYIVWQGHQDVPTYDPWVALAAMAVSTTRIRLGTMVTALPRRRPWKVARELVTLDHLSNGRMILGVGLGDTSIDISFTRFGEVTDDKQRARMLDEALEVIAGLWTGAPFTFHGEHYTVDNVELLPRPMQTPRIPIWVGGAYPHQGPMRRAARWDGACLYKVTNEDMTPDDIRAIKAFIEERRTATGPFDIAAGGRARDADWEKDRALIRALGDAGVTWYVEYIPPAGYDETRADIERGPLQIER